MNRKKAIKISKPCLVRIRNSFRGLIIKIVREQLYALGQLTSACYDEEEVDYNKIQSLVDEQSSLRIALRDSICKCAACSDFKRDHVYNPNEKKWYCEECYEILKKSYTEVDKMSNWFP